MSRDPVHTRPAEAALLRELDGLRQDLRDHRDEVRREITETRAEVSEKLDDIVAEARRTNGRLKKAELWIAAVKGVSVFLVVVTLPIALKIIDHYL